VKDKNEKELKARLYEVENEISRLRNRISYWKRKSRGNSDLVKGRKGPTMVAGLEKCKHRLKEEKKRLLLRLKEIREV
jgi:hypothetical protein